MSVNTGWSNWYFKSHEAGLLGDNRFKYVPFYQLAPAEQEKARRQYPNKVVGGKYNFVDEHYLYPIKEDQTLAEAQRVLGIPLSMIQNDNEMALLGYEVNPDWTKEV